jgi:hypothetical protein
VLEQVQALLKAGPTRPACVPHEQALLFAPVDRYCRSFSQWWRQTDLVG